MKISPVCILNMRTETFSTLRNFLKVWPINTTCSAEIFQYLAGRQINSADPDQTAPKEQSDQGLHCLHLILKSSILIFMAEFSISTKLNWKL